MPSDHAMRSKRAVRIDRHDRSVVPPPHKPSDPLPCAVGKLNVGVVSQALDDVADVDIIPINADNLVKHPCEQLAGGADERLPLLVLVEARSLPDEHHVRICAPDAEDHLRTPVRQPTPGAVGRLVADLRQ
jgi:hypothetical protein